MKRRNKRSPVLGYLGFFLMIAVTVTAAVMIYDAANAKLNGNTGIVAVIMLLVVIVLALVCTVTDGIRRRIKIDKPLEDILEATEKIAKGDFFVRLTITHPYGHYDEFDYIMDNLNKMAEELSKNEALGNDFVANVSHELKTPLSVIRSYAATMRDDKISGKKREEYADILENAAARLTNLVENILKLNRLENSKIDAETELVKLDDIIAQTVIKYEDKLDEKNININADIEEITLSAVPAYIEIILSNLISNAVKFTEQGGEIGIYLKKENGKAVIKVSDNGCGMSKETGERIFDKFYQGDTSHSKEGNGLGLSLVKKVIDIMGGEISVESVLGKGTEFTVILEAVA